MPHTAQEGNRTLRNMKSDSVVLGNVYNKYASRNPVARRLLANYLRALADLLKGLNPSWILEVGCGEGYLSEILSGWMPRSRLVGVDLSLTLFRREVGQPSRLSFAAQSAYQLGFSDQSVDLIVAAEVLEHLEDPDRAMQEINRVARGKVLLSVPREPLWRILNLARLSYLREWGNTPGHLQHWSPEGFAHFVAQHLNIRTVRNPLPWTMILAEKKA